MVSEKEIVEISKLMRIKIVDHREYVGKVHTMIDFFDVLDSAGATEEDLDVCEVPISYLREDKHEAFDGVLIDELKHYKNGYIRAPGMN